MKKNNRDVCIITFCPFCGKSHEVECNEDDYLDWQDGELIQNAMPYLSAQEREYLITGICEDCWSRMFDGMDTEDALYEED